MEKKNEIKPTKGKNEDQVKAKTISVFIGGAMLVACGFVIITGDTIGEILWLWVLIGLGLFGGGLFEFLGLSKPLKDERVARIGTRAATYSWYATLTLVGFMAMVFGMGGGHKITMPQAVGATLIVMVASILLLNWRLGRAGDLEE
jgi:hypothetical protein